MMVKAGRLTKEASGKSMKENRESGEKRQDGRTLHGIRLHVDKQPALDPGFLPLGKFNRAFLEEANQPFAIAVERPNQQISVYDTCLCGRPEMREADLFFADRLVKTLLWMKGGYKITLYGDTRVYQDLNHAYSLRGRRSFDRRFMESVYERPFEVCLGNYEDKPENQERSQSIGGHLDGCRIGFDAGGSDRKVSAVIDGIPVFSEEVVWHPKVNADPDYHFNEIVTSLKTAAAHMPRVDAIGISSAGIYIDNRTMAASLFLQVPDHTFEQKVKDIYVRAAKAVADVPVVVCNDGDVSALAGSMSLKENSILGIAMGTSQATGFVDEHGNITGWLNELAFAPVDLQEGAAVDAWSGDAGCGVQYFSQEAVIRLAPKVGLALDPDLTPAEKLASVQQLVGGDPRVEAIFTTIGTYLGHTLASYYDFYGCRQVLLLGRVMSGAGGELIATTAKGVLAEEYPRMAPRLNLVLPDEKTRRVGQSVAAASLPEIHDCP